jgi:hypothetical protein
MFTTVTIFGYFNILEALNDPCNRHTLNILDILPTVLLLYLTLVILRVRLLIFVIITMLLLKLKVWILNFRVPPPFFLMTYFFVCLIENSFPLVCPTLSIKFLLRSLILSLLILDLVVYHYNNLWWICNILKALFSFSLWHVYLKILNLLDVKHLLLCICTQVITHE